MAVKQLTKVKVTPLVLAVSIIFALAAGAGGMYLYEQYTSRPVDELSDIQAKLSKSIVLPQEQPTFATVADITKLKNQPFFAHAANGDKVLIYPQAKKAIIYRPSTGKIIDVGPLTASDNATGSQSAAIATTTPLSVAIYNGTTVSGLTKKAQATVESISPAIAVVKRGDAAKSDYTGTQVIDLTGKNKQASEMIAKAMHASVASIPAGEEKPEADLLIILGADFTSGQ